LKERSLCHFQYVWNRSRGVDESNVLGSLPSSLKGDIVLFMNKNLFQNVRWFKNCSRGFVRSIATRLEQHLFLSQEIIFSRGHMGQHMFFINEGIIQIIVDHEQQQSVTLKSGDFFGHKAVIHSTPRTYTAIAKSACELLSLSVAKFEELLDYEPNLPQMLAEQDIVEQILSPSSNKPKIDDSSSSSMSRTPTSVKIEMEERSVWRDRAVSDSHISMTSLRRFSKSTRRNSAVNVLSHRNSSEFLSIPQRPRPERHSMYDITSQEKRKSIMTVSSFDVIDAFRRKLSAQSKEILDSQTIIEKKKTM